MSPSDGTGWSGGSRRLPVIEGFELEEVIGRGGFATVYRARQVALDRVVALKVMHAGVHPDADTLRRFERECQAIGSLTGHPSVMTLFRAGVSAEGDPYLALEYLPGGSLQQQVDREGPLAWPQAVPVAVAVAQALAAAHEIGIVHRDVKPANVLADRLGHYKLGDFGISGMASGSSTSLATTAATVAYIGPEVLLGKRATPRTDLYGLGATIYTVLTGSPAFWADTDESIVPMIYRVTTEPLEPLPEAAAPPWLRELVEQLMAKDPDDRPESAADVLDRIREATPPAVADGVEAAGPSVLPPPPVLLPPPPPPGSAPPPPALAPVPPAGLTAPAVLRTTDPEALSPAAAATSPSPDTSPTPTEAPGRTRSRRVVAAAAVLVALALGGVAAAAALTGSGDGTGGAAEASQGGGDDRGGSSPASAKVPKVTGLTEARATQVLAKAGFEAKVTARRPDDRVPEGQVANQVPGAGATLRRGARVQLAVSTGPAPRPIPEVVGRPADQALVLLAASGFTAVDTQVEFSDQPVNTVLRVTPDVGSAQAKGTRVTIVVSKGPEPVAPQTSGGGSSSSGGGSTGGGSADGGSTGGGGGTPSPSPSPSPTPEPQPQPQPQPEPEPQPDPVPDDTTCVPRYGPDTYTPDGVLIPGPVVGYDCG